MKIEVTNYGGIKSAAVEFPKLTFLMGANGAGKSTILRAAGSCLQQQVLTIPKTSKNKSSIYVRHGSTKGTISLSTADGSATINYPEPVFKPKGKLPYCSAYAAGLDSICDQSDNERVKTLLEYLKADPTPEELLEALKKIDVAEPKAIATVEYVGVHGYPAAHAKATENRAKYKGGWEEITGENYGSGKAEDWEPEHWTPDLKDETEETLEKAWRDAQAAYAKALEEQAVTADELEKSRVLAATWEMVVLKYQAAEETRKNTAIALQNAQLELARLSEGSHAYAGSSARCPWEGCGKAIKYEKGEYLKWEGVDDMEAMAKRHNEMEAARKACKTAEAALDQAATALAEVTEESRKVKRAKDIVEQWASKQITASAALDSAAHIAAVEKAYARKTAWIKKTKADEKQRLIVETAAIAKLLDASGLRQTKLADKLKDFNEQLKAWTDIAGWALVEIQPDMDITYNGRSYAIASDGEQARVRLILQVVQAQTDKSSAILFDVRRDVDSACKNGIVKVLMALGLPSIVCMVAKKDEAERYASAINTYWVENGETVCLSKSMALT